MSNRYNFNEEIKVGRWTVKVDTLAGHGYFEHDIHGEGGELTFGTEDGEIGQGNRYLLDYDGRFELPTAVLVALATMGFTVGEDFKP